MQKRSSWKFVAVGLSALIFIVCNIPFRLQLWLKRGLFECQAPLLSTYSKAKDIFDYWLIRTYPKHVLIEKCRDLARENAYLRMRTSEILLEKEKCKAFWQLYSLPQSEVFDYQLARVAKRHIDTWNQYLYLNKGSSEGIVESAGVIYSGGVVGRIVEVYTHTSVVELITNPSFRMVVVDPLTKTPIVYQGTGCSTFFPLYGKAHNIPSSFSPKKFPIQLVTSHLSEIFPPNIVVGKLENVEIKNGVAHGNILLDERLARLEEVSILVPIKSLKKE